MWPAVLEAVQAAERHWHGDDALPVTAELAIGHARRGPGTFNGNVDAMLFHATFAALCPLASSVSGTDTDSVSAYAGSADGDELARRVVYEFSGDNCGASEWRRTFAPAERTVHEHRRDVGWPFHVAVTAAGARRVAMPASVRVARAKTCRLQTPQPALNHASTRASQPASMRHNRSRCLRFAEAPAWLVRFTVVQETSVAFASNGIAGEHMYHIDEERYRVALRYVPVASHEPPEDGEVLVPAPDWTPDQAVAQAEWLLARLATAVGPDPVRVFARMQNDCNDYEMAAIEATLDRGDRAAKRRRTRLLRRADNPRPAVRV